MIYALSVTAAIAIYACYKWFYYHRVCIALVNLTEKYGRDAVDPVFIASKINEMEAEKHDL